MFYSPLRYPGGKGKLQPFMELVIDKSGHNGGTYIEPFAGGAGLAIGLLRKNYVSQIVINDYDKRIYSFWRAALSESERFIEMIHTIPLTMDEWYKQREICIGEASKYSFGLGFATFYMNRTNRSGIIKGGVIGGVDQAGAWKLDVRFNRDELAKRIEAIAAFKSSIVLYNQDIKTLINNYIPKYGKDSLVFFDPPYYKKGKQLYINYFNHGDHVEIEKRIRQQVKCDWVVTYDDVPEIEEIYKKHRIHKFDLNYSVANNGAASEIIVFSDESIIPTKKELKEKKIRINLR